MWGIEGTQLGHNHSCDRETGPHPQLRPPATQELEIGSALSKPTAKRQRERTITALLLSPGTSRALSTSGSTPMISLFSARLLPSGIEKTEVVEVDQMTTSANQSPSSPTPPVILAKGDFGEGSGSTRRSKILKEPTVFSSRDRPRAQEPGEAESWNLYPTCTRGQGSVSPTVKGGGAS